MRMFMCQNSLFFSRNKNRKRQHSSSAFSTRVVERSPKSRGRRYSTKYRVNSNAAEVARTSRRNDTEGMPFVVRDDDLTVVDLQLPLQRRGDDTSDCIHP